MWRNRNAHTPNPSQPDHNCETNVTIPIPSVFNPTPVRRLALSPRAIPRSPPFGPLLSRRQHRSIERAITPPPSKATPHACIASKTDPTEKKKQLPTSPAIQTIVRTVRACPVFRSQLPFTSPPAFFLVPPPPPPRALESFTNHCYSRNRKTGQPALLSSPSTSLHHHATDLVVSDGRELYHQRLEWNPFGDDLSCGLCT